MCEICGNNPCQSRCPNADEPETRAYCTVCGEALREDYTYFEDKNGNVFCSEDCALEYYKIEETEWS